MHCRTIGIGYTPQGVKLGDDPKPAIWGLRALLIQIGIELSGIILLFPHCLRALLIQIGIERLLRQSNSFLRLRALLIQIGIEL